MSIFLNNINNIPGLISNSGIPDILKNGGNPGFAPKKEPLNNPSILIDPKKEPKIIKDKNGDTKIVKSFNDIYTDLKNGVIDWTDILNNYGNYILTGGVILFIIIKF